MLWKVISQNLKSDQCMKNLCFVYIYLYFFTPKYFQVTTCTFPQTLISLHPSLSESFSSTDQSQHHPPLTDPVTTPSSRGILHVHLSLLSTSVLSSPLYLSLSPGWSVRLQRRAYQCTLHYTLSHCEVCMEERTVIRDQPATHSSVCPLSGG